MNILTLLNECENWKDILEKNAVRIKTETMNGDTFMMLKYGLLNPELFNQYEWMRECRGSIFVQGADGKWKYACRPFDKFGNYGECYVPQLDWNSVRVHEKVDGSLIKVWKYNGHVYISTNGTINAFNCFADGAKHSFGDLFIQAFGGFELFDDFVTRTDLENWTYMFELVSPETELTVHYGVTAAYFLTARNVVDGSECMQVALPWTVRRPKEFMIYSIAEALAYVQTMTKNEEGFVICDKYCNRMKLKSPEFLAAFKMRGNGKITDKKILKYWLEDKLDDVIAYFPEAREHIYSVLFKIDFIADKLFDEIQFLKKNNITTRRELGHWNADFYNKGYMFRYLQNGIMPLDYLKSLTLAQLCKMMEE